MDGNPNLTPEQLQELEDARARAKDILAAARVASFNAWTLGIFAGLTILTGLTSLPTLVLGVGMAVVARNEWRGKGLLRRFDPKGPELLYRNQIGLLVMAVAYCGWRLLAIYAQPDPEWAQLQDLLSLEPRYIQDLMAAGYVAAILGAVVFVGLNARYYGRRAPMVAEYLRDTPGWVLDIQRASALE